MMLASGHGPAGQTTVRTATDPLAGGSTCPFKTEETCRDRDAASQDTDPEGPHPEQPAPAPQDL